MRAGRTAARLSGRPGDIFAKSAEQVGKVLPGFIWRSDYGGNLDYVGAWALDYLQQPKANILGRGWLAFLHPDDVGVTVLLGDSALRTGTNFQTRHRLRGSGNEYRWFETKGNPVRDSSGRIKAWCGQTRELSERQTTDASVGASLEADLFENRLAQIAELEMALEEVSQPVLSILLSHQACLDLLRSGSDNLTRAQEVLEFAICDAEAVLDTLRLTKALRRDTRE